MCPTRCHTCRVSRSEPRRKLTCANHGVLLLSMKTTTYNTCIKPLEAITGRRRKAGLSAQAKEKLLDRHLNPSRYEFVGFVDRTNDAILRPRFYNVRDENGRFASVG